MIIKNTFEEYKTMDGVNHSFLKHMKLSPYHARYNAENPPEQSKAQSLGSLLHIIILEPERKSEITELPTYDLRKKADKEAKAQFELENVGKLFVTAENFEILNAMEKMIFQNENAALLLQDSIREFAVQWTNAATGVLCKARLDAYNENCAVLIDLKTTKDVSDEGFSRELYNYSYYTQAAFYMDGMRTELKPVENFVFIAIENTLPCGVKIYNLNDESISLGHRENIERLKKYKECTQTNSWECYSGKIEDISVPYYKLK